jgi:hypothetical protein
MVCGDLQLGTRIISHNLSTTSFAVCGPHRPLVGTGEFRPGPPRIRGHLRQPGDGPHHRPAPPGHLRAETAGRGLHRRGGGSPRGPAGGAGDAGLGRGKRPPGGWERGGGMRFRPPVPMRIASMRCRRRRRWPGGYGICPRCNGGKCFIGSLGKICQSGFQWWIIGSLRKGGSSVSRL